MVRSCGGSELVRLGYHLQSGFYPCLQDMVPGTTRSMALAHSTAIVVGALSNPGTY